MRRSVHHPATSTSSRPRPATIPNSTLWSSQNRLAGWYRAVTYTCPPRVWGCVQTLVCVNRATRTSDARACPARELLSVLGADELVDHQGLVQVRTVPVHEPGHLDGREQPLPQPAVHDRASDDVDRECDEQRRDRSPPQSPDRDGDAEHEQRVRDRDDPLGVVGVDAHAAVQVVERRSRPGRERDETGGDSHRRGQAERQLRDDPATSRDALRPVEAVRAAVEVEHERRREQQRREGRKNRRPREQKVQAVEAQEERPDRDTTAARIGVSGAGGETVVRIDRRSVDADRDRDSGEDDEHRGRDQRLDALLTPADPDQRATAAGTSTRAGVLAPR